MKIKLVENNLITISVLQDGVKKTESSIGLFVIPGDPIGDKTVPSDSLEVKTTWE